MKRQNHIKIISLFSILLALGNNALASDKIKLLGATGTKTAKAGQEYSLNIAAYPTSGNCQIRIFWGDSTLGEDGKKGTTHTITNFPFDVSHSFSESKKYKISVKAEDGCKGSLSHEIYVLPEKTAECPEGWEINPQSAKENGAFKCTQAPAQHPQEPIACAEGTEYFTHPESPKAPHILGCK